MVARAIEIRSQDEDDEDEDIDVDDSVHHVKTVQIEAAPAQAAPAYIAPAPVDAPHKPVIDATLIQVSCSTRPVVLFICRPSHSCRCAPHRFWLR